MVKFLIYYKNNIAKIGRVKNRITTENSEKILTENNDYLSYIPEIGELFKVKSFYDTDSLVYRFLAIDILPSPETDTDRIIYGD